MNANYKDYSKMIDHSILSPTATTAELAEGCQLAIAYDVASVCLLPYYVKRCSKLLEGSSVKTSTTIGFPHGANTTSVKCFEAEQALRDGCQELDIVVNIGQVLSGDWDYVVAEIAALVKVTHAASQQIKIIFENCYLNNEQKLRLCQICTELGADWVKTSTGYGTSGATVEDLQLMLKNVGPRVKVKAAGGVRDFETLEKIHNMGVSRCGTSRTPSLLDPAREKFGLPTLTSPEQVPAKSSY